MRLEDLLKNGAVTRRESVAVVAGKGRHTYAELDLVSDRLAVALHNRGVRRGSRIAAFMTSGWPSVVSLFAVLKAGALFNPLDPALQIDVLGPILAKGNAAGIVTETRLASAAGAALSAAPAVRLVVLAGGGSSPATDTCLSFEEVIARTAPALPPDASLDESDAAVAFGPNAPFSHREILAAAGSSAGDGDLAHWGGIGGLRRMIAAFAAGATLVLEPRTERTSGRAPDVAGPGGARYAGSGSLTFDSVSNG